MGNNIDIVWSSDQRQLMADMQKRQVMIEKDVLGLKKTADAGKQAGAVLTSSYRDSTKEIERLGRVSCHRVQQCPRNISPQFERTSTSTQGT